MALLRVPNRREFLVQASAVLAAAAASPLAAQSPRVRWAFFSDTHIPADPKNEYRGFRPQDNLRRVVSEVMEANVSGAVIDGDLARLAGSPEDYAALKTLLAPVLAKMPVAMALGNHDNRDNFSAAFAEHPGEEQLLQQKHVLVVPAGPVKLILLDSLMLPNFTPGFLGKQQRVWLEQYLPAQGDTPVIVFVHHTLGEGDIDLLDAHRLLPILQASSNVKALIYGHSHSYSFENRNGLHLINIPAVGYNFQDSAPVGWLEVELSKEGADFKLHAIGGSRAGDGKVTSVTWRG